MRLSTVVKAEPDWVSLNCVWFAIVSIRLEAIASRLEAIPIRFLLIGWRCVSVCSQPSRNGVDSARLLGLRVP